MGKKSVTKSSFENVNVPTEVRALYGIEDLQEGLIQMLKTQRKQPLDLFVYYCCCMVNIVGGVSIMNVHQLFS